MASLKGLFDFENFFSEEFFKDLLKHPSKLIFGVDPLGVEIGNLVLGRKDKSLINQLGSPSNDIQKKARAKGIDTGLANTLHDTGDIAAGLIGGYGAVQGLGNIGAAAEAGGGIIPAGSGGGGGIGGAMAGGGAPTGGGGIGGGAEAGAAGFDWQSLIQQFGGGVGQQQKQDTSLEDAMKSAQEAIAREQKKQAEEAQRQQLLQEQFMAKEDAKKAQQKQLLLGYLQNLRGGSTDG